MSGNLEQIWPVWAVVLLCALVNQLMKLGAYSLTRGEFAFAAFGQSHGLPSSPAAVLSCLLVLVTLRTGWQSAETGLCVVFAVIVIHDTVKLRIAAHRQREVVSLLVDTLDHPSPFRQYLADYLDPRTHHPAHVAVGVVLGGLFALAFGLP